MSQLENTFIITKWELEFLLRCTDKTQNRGRIMDFKEFVGCVSEQTQCIDKILEDVKERTGK